MAENVDLQLRYLGVPPKERRERVTEILRKVGLSQRAKHYPQQLSGGQQQRVAIARAVVGKPKLILADEPTGNLDSKSGLAVMELLTQLNAEGTTIVMVTHSQHDARMANRIINLLNLLGLAIAVATFYLFMTQVIYNRTYNHNIEGHENMYRFEIQGGIFGDNWGCQICRPFVTMLKDIPQVEDVTYLCAYINEINVKIDQRDVSVPWISTGRPLSGTSKTWDDKSSTAIVSESTAKKMFGTANATGKTFLVDFNNKSRLFTVVGVSKDMPDNCTLPNGVYLCDNEQGLTNWEEWSFNIYVRFVKGTDATQMVRALKLAFMKANNISDEKQFDKEVNMKFRFTPVDNIYFSGIGMKDKGNRNLVYVLTVASIFILFIAMLNLLNFSLSTIPMRMRGINTRRVMGASVGHLRLNIVMENVGFSVVAFVIGILLIVAFQRSETCMKLVSGDIHFATHATLTAMMVLIVLAVGALSAVIPALYSTSFTPAMVLKGSFGLSPRGRKLRMAIMTIQFCVAFALTIYIGVMSSQSHYIFNSDYGFAKDEVFYVTLSKEAMAKKDAISAELSKLPFVESIGYAQSSIGASDNYMGWGRGDSEHKMSFQVLPCDYHFLHTMGLKMVDGRDFKESDMKTGAYVVNRALMNQYPWLRVGEPIGRQNAWGDQLTTP